MGLILKQSFKGTVYSYLGVVLGFITTGILFPRLLDPEQIGLLSNLVAYSLLLSQIFSLGFNNVTNRLFPYFRNSSSKHQGYSLILLFVFISGMIVFVATFPLLRKLMIIYNKENATLFNQYISYIVPLVAAFLVFSLFDSYLKALYNAALGIFLREFVQRLLILLCTLLLAFELFRFSTFVYLYIGCFIIPAIAVIFYLASSNEISLRTKYLNVGLLKKLKKEILVVGAFGIIGGLSTIIVMTLDKIMLAHYTGLKNTGIYTIAFYFGTLVLIPSRSVIKISTTVVAEAWKKNDMETIRTIYYKSCMNQFIIGLILLLGIWINIDNVFHIITKDFTSGKYVILFIGVMNLIDMATGVNGIIIGTSKYYRFQTYFILLLGVLTILTNMYFIPRYGLNGAALATLLSGTIYNASRMLFLYVKFRMQPFNVRFLYTLMIGIALYMVTKEFIVSGNVVFDIIIKSLLLGGTYIVIVYILRISEDLNNVLNKFKGYLIGRFKKFK